MSDSVRVRGGAPEPQGPGEDPLYHYNRILVRFLQLVFASYDEGKYRWHIDPQLTNITITDQATIAHDAVEQRPAILVARGTASFANLSMDQFNGPTFKNGKFIPNSDPETGAKRYTDLISASAVYNCLSSEGVEAGRIAWIASMATRRLKKSLMHAGMHRVGEEVTVGPETPPGAIVSGDPREIILVPVTVPFYFQDFWTVEPADKVLLKNIDIAVRSTLNFSLTERALNAPAINGRILEYDRSKALSLSQRVHVTGSRTPKPR